MQNMMNSLRTIFKSHSLVTWIACAYIFFSHVPRTTALVNLLSGAMLISWIFLAARKGFVLDWRSGLVRAYSCFFLVVLVGIVFSPYWQESLIPLRRELIPMTLAFVLLTAQRTVQEGKQQRSVALLVAASLISAFVVRTFLALVDWLKQGVENDFYSIDRAAAKFFDFYATDASLIIPIVLAAILYLVMPRNLRLLLITSVVIGLVLVVVSSVRTAVVATVIVTIAQLMPRFRSRKLWGLIAIALLSLALTMVGTGRLEKVVDRYASIFSAASYEGNEAGVSSVYERLSIWKGTLEMVSDRPLFGYGLGWQKLYSVGYDNGYVANWRESPALIDRTVARYFDAYEKGMVNPHNLWVDIVFETGALGLISYVVMLCILLVRGIHALKQKSRDAVEHWFGGATLAFLLAYGLVNMMGGFWLTSGATLTLLIVSELLSQRRINLMRKLKVSKCAN